MKTSNYVIDDDNNVRFGSCRAVTGRSYGPEDIGVTLHFGTILIKPNQSNAKQNQPSTRHAINF